MVTPRSPLLSWAVIVPLLAMAALALTWGRDLGVVLVAVVAVFLAGAVLAAVHHAEVVAHRVGEPFGSLVLAVAVTVIEVALIVTVMVSGGPETASPDVPHFSPEISGHLGVGFGVVGGG